MMLASVPEVAEDQIMSTTVDEESKEKTPTQQQAFGQKDVWVDSDSDEDGEKEEQRARKVAKELNKQRRARSKSRKKVTELKRQKVE